MMTASAVERVSDLGHECLASVATFLKYIVYVYTCMCVLPK